MEQKTFWKFSKLRGHAGHQGQGLRDVIEVVARSLWKLHLRTHLLSLADLLSFEQRDLRLIRAVQK